MSAAQPVAAMQAAPWAPMLAVAAASGAIAGAVVVGIHVLHARAHAAAPGGKAQPAAAAHAAGAAACTPEAAFQLLSAGADGVALVSLPHGAHPRKPQPAPAVAPATRREAVSHIGAPPPAAGPYALQSPLQTFGRRDPTDPTPRVGAMSWDDYFMALAFLSAERSKDPNKQVGAVIVNADHVILAIGYNGFPRGCCDSDLPWAKVAHRPDGSHDALGTKYPYVVHAEANALLNKNAASVAGARMYVTMFPCNECAKLLIQAGIREVVYHEDKVPLTAAGPWADTATALAAGPGAAGAATPSQQQQPLQQRTPATPPPPAAGGASGQALRAGRLCQQQAAQACCTPCAPLYERCDAPPPYDIAATVAVLYGGGVQDSEGANANAASTPSTASVASVTSIASGAAVAGSPPAGVSPAGTCPATPSSGGGADADVSGGARWSGFWTSAREPRSRGPLAACNSGGGGGGTPDAAATPPPPPLPCPASPSASGRILASWARAPAAAATPPHASLPAEEYVRPAAAAPVQAPASAPTPAAPAVTTAPQPLSAAAGAPAAAGTGGTAVVPGGSSDACYLASLRMLRLAGVQLRQHRLQRVIQLGA